MRTIINFLDTASFGHIFIDSFLSDSLMHLGNDESGRYDEGTGDRPWQHDPAKRAAYLATKRDVSDIADKYGFSKTSASYIARSIVANSDIDIGSASSSSSRDAGHDMYEEYKKHTYVTPEINDSPSEKDVRRHMNRVKLEEDARRIFSENEGTSKQKENKSENGKDKQKENKSETTAKDPWARTEKDVRRHMNRVKLEEDARRIFSENEGTSKQKENKSKNGKDKQKENKSETTAKDPWARTEKGGKDKPNISQAERLARDVKNTTDDLIDGASKILRSMNDNKKLKNNAKGLSNEELRERIARIRLEKEYNQLTANDTRSGYDKTMRILNTVGTAVSVGAGVVSIVAGVKNMKAGKRYG